MAILFSITLFLAAALLFAVEPMVGKLLLPTFGGAPAVWNTCLVFFQASLLAGYGYAHFLTRRLPPPAQMAVHAIVVLAAWLALPIATSPRWLPPGDAHPTPWLLAMLAATAGLPFFAVSTAAPLLQKWFADSGHRQAHDPYFLYAASNAGSMIGLLAYPLAIEPNLTLTAQGRAWAMGYTVFCVLLAACAAKFWQGQRSAALLDDEGLAAPAARQTGRARPNAPVSAPPSTWTRLRWIALAFVPSSLLLSVTEYLSADVSPVPLMWVAPLALYLLTFILVFARLPGAVHRLMTLLLPVAILTQAYFVLTEHAGSRYSMTWLVELHLATFFIAAMVCHGELARTRPTTEYLTEFYLWMSLGGTLGGLFNTLLAPLVFRSMAEYPLSFSSARSCLRSALSVFSSMAEYPLALALACMLSPPLLLALPRFGHMPGLPRLRLVRLPRRLVAQSGQLRRHAAANLVIPVLVGLASATILFRWGPETSRWPVVAVLSLCALTAGRPVRLGLSVAAMFWAASWYDDVVDHLVYRERSFYGVLQVKTDADDAFYNLDHGRIRHGRQRRSQDANQRDLPLVYYYPTGPIGQVFQGWPGRARRVPVGVVGLGVGSLAAYGQPGQELTFFEIDPAVERIARDSGYFTYLADSAANCRVMLGDARLSLAREPNGHYALIVVDAFSGDAIPVHLLTREAMQLYVSKLTAGGILAFHISNRFLDLAPVLGNVAEELRLAGLDELYRVNEAEMRQGGSDSHWVVVARRAADLQWLARDDRWQPLVAQPDLPVWTDDYTSLWGIAHLSDVETVSPRP